MKEENHERKIDAFFIFHTLLVIFLRCDGLKPRFFYKLKNYVLAMCCVNFTSFGPRVLMLSTLISTWFKSDFVVRRAQFWVWVARC